ncbi:hypothetical protein GYO_1736 [Bacillus spizizenii TU-B-10]|uniref:Uncharacterized protein n=1 Tax=Bacillus spizizenii (strain DSM 15029 / JCM 12233 / NBRC 101239 / NRRL B-23049 / TU-B-10) TaxID=1052585 RepID=G4NVL8_BACS4|nr:hypothetical protein GYO_1736 [Bacillus spizizenii TU-B-10]SCV40713.1 hypothetical protein BQ1740_1839 [Bacillus subtilis]
MVIRKKVSFLKNRGLTLPESILKSHAIHFLQFTPIYTVQY